MYILYTYPDFWLKGNKRERPSFERPYTFSFPFAIREDRHSCSKSKVCLVRNKAQSNPTLLGAPGIATGSKKLLVTRASLLGARTLLGAPILCLFRSPYRSIALLG